MNTKVAVGLVGAVILVVVGYFLANRPVAPIAPQTTGTSTTTASEQVIGAPTSLAGVGADAQHASAPKTSAPKITVGSGLYVRFDSYNMVTGSDHPSYTGTANVPKVTIVVVNSAGVGIAGSQDIPVIDGKWEYSAPPALAPGTYTIQLSFFGLDHPAVAKVTVVK